MKMDKVATAYTVIVNENAEEVNEGFLKNAAVATALVATITAGVVLHMKSEPKQDTVHVGEIDNKQHDPNHPDSLLSSIKEKYKNIKPDVAHEVINAAIKHGDPVFPQAHHLVAIAGVESTLNPNAKSKLKKDPAVGLLQVRPKVWNLNKKDLDTVDKQIGHGAKILKKYHATLGNPTDAIKAYNIGITNHLRGKQSDAADRYHSKVDAEIKRVSGQ